MSTNPRSKSHGSLKFYGCLGRYLAMEAQDESARCIYEHSRLPKFAYTRVERWSTTRVARDARVAQHRYWKFKRDLLSYAFADSLAKNVEHPYTTTSAEEFCWLAVLYVEQAFGMFQNLLDRSFLMYPMKFWVNCSYSCLYRISQKLFSSIDLLRSFVEFCWDFGI